MQTRDYDDYIFITSTLGFRKVNDLGNQINQGQETDGYCNMYANSIAVSYLHSMQEPQLNAIHFFEENHEIIFKTIYKQLLKKYQNPKLELGFRHVNILDSHKKEVCFTEYVFVDSNQKKVVIKMHKDQVQP
ncbi:MAG: hypothetical protein ACPG6B_10100 [Oceanihabitans sp.]